MEKPQTVTAVIGGKERKLLLCMWGLMLAEKAGYDVAGLDLGAEANEARKGELTQMLELLWVAALPFERSLTLEELGMSITLGDLPAVAEAFSEVMRLQMGEDLRAEVARVRRREAAGNVAKKKRPPRDEAKASRPKRRRPSRSRTSAASSSSAAA